ncbi:hypothetical protein Esi_0069_0004 [Ectocarpus siliculosus]|uniref:Uncharacterized protein n=1 Tax=Ectocarpus siliculosus TaxID=2880 RepID=D8LRJ4_ECTSI|nr:hypothetical protein Esi_0069_0004 [Ectocarpus siliculosus]|eukprot:CBN77755.1 hypothetical protein Esi_0069_0004 [Ectocarpus siliculosus]
MSSHGARNGFLRSPCRLRSLPPFPPLPPSSSSPSSPQRLAVAAIKPTSPPQALLPPSLPTTREHGEEEAADENIISECPRDAGACPVS